ncbi:hypothetical protein WA026_008270 [Henosepilachna vigintioctopunctata]|uniref:Uncharacterized protein n=1 Tax=Henosepilachna vigintioctopunctata TaxID=420089 RepID=A0AAW1TL26_9CUCU
MLNSYSRSSSEADKNLNDTKITTSIMPPQITSTPCISPSKSRKVSPLITPRRFLGPRRYALSSNGTLSKLKTINDPPGPLLTATSYNVNVSTYIDSKSPGYTARLIQYNEESSRNQQLTHQEKYGSPGLFPIVHLFKKDVPIITPKPKQTTVRIGTPDLKGQYSQEHSRLLLEGIVRTNSVIKENSRSGNDVSTRSVLDALKEISRKRIHATEEYERDDSNKKLRRDFINGGGDCSKRNREVDSPTSDSCTSPVAKQPMKKLCTIDAVLASKTSSMYANYDIGNKRKTVADRKSMVSPLNKKKFNNAETQTVGASSQKPGSVSMETSKGSLEQKETVHKQTQSTIVVEETKSPPKQVLKIFDDKPLEIIRKNRLGALLSALTGHEIPPIPMEDRRKALDQEWRPKKPEKELVSILSSPDKPPKNSDKHVTFNISENSTKSSNSTQSTESTLLPNNSTEVLKVDSVEQKGSTETQGTTKCSNLQMTFQSSGEKSVDKVKDDVAVPSIGDFKFGSTKAVEPTLGPSGGFKFDLSKPQTTAKDSIDKNSFSQSNPSTDVSLITETNKNLISSSVADSSPSSTPSVLPKFGITPELSTSLQLPLNNSLSGEIFSNSVSPSTKTNSLGLPTALPVTTSQSSFGKGTSVSFTFGSAQSVITSNSFTKSKPNLVNNEGSSKPSSFLESNVSESKVSSTSAINTSLPKNDVNSTLAFKPQTIPNSLSVHSPSTLASTDNISTTNSNTPSLDSTPNFGIIASSKTSTAFGIPTSIPTFVSSSKNIEFATTSSSIHGGLITSVVSSSTPNSTTALARAGGFSFTNSLPAFPAKSTLASGTSTSKPSNTVFSNSSNSSDMQKNIAFGTTKTTPSYDSVPSSKLSYSSPGSTQPTFMFGSGKSFGPPSNSATSTISTINSQSGMTLGTNTSASTASNIQVNSTFGTTGNAFSSAGNNILDQSTSIASFGTTCTPAFGNSTTATFGTTSSPAFGISTSSSSAKPVFGSSSMPAFGTTIAPTFGSTTSSAFGTTTPTFGTANVPTFGVTTAPTFGTTTAPPFGTTTAPTFGTTTAPTFGTTTAPTFGTTTSPSFGSNTAPTFGATSVAGFGTTVAETFGTNIAPTFGSTSATIFGTTSAPTFGTNKAPSFGTTTATSFGTSGTPSFASSAFGISTVSSTFGTSNALNFSAPNMNSSTFGNTPNFAAPGGTKSLFATTNTLPFENTKTTTGGFATSNNFAIPSTAANAFGKNTSSFGAPSSNPLFATTNTSSFVSSSTTPAFGTTTATFGAPLTFGTTPTTSVGTFNSNNANLPFGNSSTNSFSTFGNANGTFNPVTTAASFGSNNNFVNSPSTNFGNNMANNAFGNTGSPFGTGANATTFGNNNAAGTNGFGSGFGGTTSKPEQSNIFPSQTNPMFGNSTNFGSLQSNNTANPGVSSNGVFTFGSPNTQTSLSNGVFAFGATESSKTFNFSAPGTSGNVSGPSASSFQAGSLNGAVPNMFNIGSGSSTTQNRSRQTTRAKRRT